MPPVSPDLAARFRADLECLVGGAGGRYLLAVSGGGDSLALLLLARGAGLRVEAATVDHGLRPESAAEAAFVGGVCANLGIAHQPLGPGRPYIRGNVQDWARRVRYDSLHAWAATRQIDWIVTAHHADDQLETMIMRMNRGSGAGGLAGIRARSGRVLRPLLGWRRAELAAIVAASGITPVDDPSNRDDRFDRARLRKALAGADWLDPRAAAASAAALAQAEEALDWAVTEAIRTRLVRTGDTVHIDPHGLPDELVRRIFAVAVEGLARSPSALRGGPVTRAIAALREGRTITLGGVRCVGGARWTLRLAPPRRKPAVVHPRDAIVP